MADNAFGPTVAAWVAKTEKRLVELPRETARVAARELRRPKSEGGAMPVETGNLRNSLEASTVGMPSVDFTKKKRFRPNDAQIENAIAEATLGQTIYLGFRAPYARKAEEDNAFVRLTAQRTPKLVEEAVATVKARTGE